MRHVTESRNEETPSKLDWPGALLVTLALGGITYGLIESSNVGWENQRIIASATLGMLAMAGFIAVEMRSEAPMMPTRLFRSSAFTGANLLTLLLYAGFGGGLFFVPLNLIQIQGYSTTAAGAALLPLILLLAMLSRWSGGLVERYGARAPLVIGPTVAAGGFALFAVPGVGGGYWDTFFPAVLVLGLGMAISVAPLTTVVMNSAAPGFAGAASGINNAASRVAGLLAVALFGLIMTSTFSRSLHRELERAELMPHVIEAVEKQRNKLAAIELPAGMDAQDAVTANRAIAEAFVAGFRRVMLISAGLALASAASALILIGDPRQRTHASQP